MSGFASVNDVYITKWTLNSDSNPSIVFVFVGPDIEKKVVNPRTLFLDKFALVEE